jgi:DNA-binding NarL/FixJ family response regulator
MKNDPRQPRSTRDDLPVRSGEVAIRKGAEVFTTVQAAMSGNGQAGNGPATPGKGRAGAITLTPRERDVLRLLVEGHSDAQIATLLDLSRRTVSEHVSNLLKKFGVSSRVALAVHAIRTGLT